MTDIDRMISENQIERYAFKRMAVENYDYTLSEDDMDDVFIADAVDAIEGETDPNKRPYVTDIGGRFEGVEIHPHLLPDQLVINSREKPDMKLSRGNVLQKRMPMKEARRIRNEVRDADRRNGLFGMSAKRTSPLDQQTDDTEHNP